MMRGTKAVNNKIELRKLGKEVIWLLFYILFLVIFLYFIFIYLGIFTNYKQFIVVSESMNPVIKNGDIVTVNTKFDVNSLKVDDIIAFYQDIDNDCKKEVVIHYIADISCSEQNKRVFLTRSANALCQNYWDDWQILDCEIVGKYVFHLLILGKFFIFIKSTVGRLVVLFNAISIVVIVKIFRYKEQIARVGT